MDQQVKELAAKTDHLRSNPWDRVPGSGQRPTPWLRIRTVLQVLALRSLRPRSLPPLWPKQVQARRRLHSCFVFPADSAFPHCPSRTGSQPREVRAGVAPGPASRTPERPQWPPTSPRFWTFLDTYSGKALLEEERETQVSFLVLNRLRDQWSLLLFKTNF